MAVDHFYRERFSACVAPGDPPGYEPLRDRSVSASRLLLVSLSSGTFPLAAQGLGLGVVSEDRPIAISATSGIEWQQDAQVYVARGNAVAKRGTTEVSADTLTAHYRPSKGREAIPRSIASMQMGTSRSRGRRRPLSATRPFGMSINRRASSPARR